MSPWHLLLLAPVLLLLASTAMAAHFTDTFATDPGEVGRVPFTWGIPALGGEAPSAWRLVEGGLEYRTEGERLREATAFMWDTGVEITDDTTWSLEVGFRHVSGVPATAQHEAIIYVGWPARTAGHYSLLSLCYDAGRKQLVVLNGAGSEPPIPADLEGGFHALRLVVEGGQVRVFVDGGLVCGPRPVGSLPCESPAWFIMGPITAGGASSFRCQWKYLAYTDEGAFVPGSEPDWHPERETVPVATALDPGLPQADPKLAFDHPPYPGIRVLGREAGAARFERARSELVKRWYEVGNARPAQVVVPEYQYPGVTGPVAQNVYRWTLPLQVDERRVVAMQMLTRGIDDTIFGYMDYKMWYCVSLDGGLTYDEERPVVQEGDEYSITHPIRYVWAGTNSFCFATLPPAMLLMSNGEVFMPCYYAPLDDQGVYYNPNKTSTYSNVCGLIGLWNEDHTDLRWECTDPIAVTPEESSGGLSECGMAELSGKPGHIFMTIRGGNEGDRTGRVPCWKWRTLSTDYGRTWSRPEPLTFSDGTAFYSPTSLNSLIRSSVTGKLYWLGNISRVRPRAGWPRYPLVLAEVDEERLGLRRETVTVIDDRGPQDGSDLQLSNWGLEEDAATGHILVTLDRMRGGPGAEGQMTYEIEVR